MFIQGQMFYEIESKFSWSWLFCLASYFCLSLFVSWILAIQMVYKQHILVSNGGCNVFKGQTIIISKGCCNVLGLTVSISNWGSSRWFRYLSRVSCKDFIFYFLIIFGWLGQYSSVKPCNQKSVWNPKLINTSIWRGWRPLLFASSIVNRNIPHVFLHLSSSVVRTLSLMLFGDHCWSKHDIAAFTIWIPGHDCCENELKN